MRIGIFGGSFDPVHHGHLILAENCRENANLDQVWFVPCALQPHKKEGAFGSDRQRVEMIELALAGYERFQLCRVEIERGGVSFTVDTLRSIRESNPEDELFLMMGDDSLESFPSWKEPDQICKLASPLVVNRPGSGDVDLSVLKQFVSEERFDSFKQLAMSSPMIEISSTDMRDRVANEKSIRFLTPRSVEKYIETQKLYQPK